MAWFWERLADEEIERIIDGYASMVQERVDAGWHAYLLSFMFHRLGGSRAGVQAQMVSAIERTYSRSLSRMVRNPRALSQADRLPLWIACPDYPVPKRAKQSLRDVALNDGLHYGGIALVPPETRLDCRLDTFFLNYQGDCLGAGSFIRRISAEPVDRTHRKAVWYVWKAVERRWASPDELVLPVTGADVTIKVGLFEIEIEIVPDGTEKSSTTDYVRPSWDKPKRPKLSYVYQQVDPLPVAPTDTRMHSGAGIVEVMSNGELRGEYWTNRKGENGLNTSGTIVIRRDQSASGGTH